MKDSILFLLPEKKVCEINGEKTILELAQNNNIYIENACAGNGSCGKCKIKIKNYICTDITEKEKRFLTDEERKEGYHLACEVQLDFKNIEDKWCVTLPEKRKEQINKKLGVVLPRWFYTEISGDKNKTNVDQTEKNREDCGNFGIAIDIGTTTMVAMLWDLDRFTIIDVVAGENPQRVIGADILSRMKYANEKEENMHNMQKMLIGSINSMIRKTFHNLYKQVLVENTVSLSDMKKETELEIDKKETELEVDKKETESEIDRKETESEINKKEIDKWIGKSLNKVIVVGNTAMLHFFMGYSTKKLSKYPFVSEINENIIKKASDIDVIGSNKTKVEIVNIISGHIGSDITAAVLATDLLHQNNVKNKMLIDIGTNGELVLKAKGKTFACSTAAGPAFEGGCICYGMRAAEGAIQKIDLENGDLKLSVIGEKSAKGICGSGLISIVAKLLDWGIIDETGRIIDADEARNKGISFGLCRRICYEEDGVNSFILKFGAEHEKIILKQKDIRELQVAKSAICSGMEILLKEGDIEIDELDCIYIAGTFGNYLNIEEAIRIGLFPPMNKEKFQLIGNAAGTGASMILLSEKYEKQSNNLSETILRIELSENSYFSECYLKNMNFNDCCF